MKIASLHRHMLARWLTLFCAVLLAAPAMAAEPAAPSLKLVPQDASFYSAGLRLREQFDIVANSKWWAQIQETSQYQGIMMLWEFSKMDPDSPITKIEAALEDPANEELKNVLIDMVSSEVFVYGGKDFSNAVALSQKINDESSTAVFQQLGELQASDDEEMSDENLIEIRAMLKALAENIQDVEVPELVVGFRVKDPEAAQSQIRRLEAYATVLLEMEPKVAMLRGKLKREKIGESDFLKLTVDGSMIPWDKLPLDDLAEKPGQFDAIKKHLHNKQAVISVGVHKGYVLISVGPSMDHVKNLGTGPSLADSPRLAPLREMGEKRYTGVWYFNEAMMKEITFSERDLDSLATMATSLLPLADIPEGLQESLAADIPELKKDLLPLLPKPGDNLAFSFLNGRGIEYFAYDWGSNRLLDGSKPLPILKHLGGKPILAIAGRGTERPEDYDLIVKWVEKAKKHFEDHVVTTMSPEEQEAYGKASEVIYPALEKANKINRELVLPALSDSQGALVIDGLSTSSKWYTELPAYDREMPVPMPAVVLGLSDAEKFKQGLGQYKTLLSDTLAKLSEIAPEDVSPITIPDAKVETVDGGLTLYSFPMPKEMGFDAKVAPNMGINKDFAVFSLLPEQTTRIANSQPLISGSAPLMDTSRPMALAIYFDFHAAVDTARPWIEEFVGEWTRSMAELRAQFDEGDEEEIEDAIAEEMREAMDEVELWVGLVRAFHGFSSAVYEKDGALVTHAEFHIEDVD